MSKETLILESFFEKVARHPDKVYMTQPVGGGQVVEYTWAQAADQAKRMAAHLKSLDYEPGSKIAMLSKNCAHFILADLAIWMAGHVSVALFPTLNAETVAYILDHSDSKHLFVGKLDTWDEMKAGVPADMPCIAFPLAPPNEHPKWDDVIQGIEPAAENPTRAGDELAIIVYTSGSTGRPKGVMHNFAAMSAAAGNMVRELEVTAEDRCLSYLPLAHVFERAVIETASYYSGAHIYFNESLATFLADLQHSRPTVFISVPRLWLKFHQGVLQKMPQQRLDTLLKIPILSGLVKKKVLKGLGLDSVRLAGSGSAPIPAELIAWYRKMGLVLLEGYGMTEDFAYSHMSKEALSRPGYVGVPFDDVDVRISGDGEIQIKSPGNMVGYYKSPEMTAECYTEDGYFRTGDRGERLDNGLLKITGRTKELFKTSKGKYVAPVPIENLLYANSHIENCCVSGSGQPQPHALVMLSEELRADIGDAAVRDKVSAELEQLLSDVNGEVESYEELQFIAVVVDEWAIENGFLTPTMKIKRDVVEECYAGCLDEWYGSGRKVLWQS